MDIKATIQIDPASLKVMSQTDINRMTQAGNQNP